MVPVDQVPAAPDGILWVNDYEIRIYGKNSVGNPIYYDAIIPELNAEYYAELEFDLSEIDSVQVD